MATVLQYLVMPAKPEDAGFIVNKVDNLKEMMSKSLMIIDNLEKNSSADKSNIAPGS